MKPDEIKAGRKYINHFGTTYHVHEIVDWTVIYTIEGIRMNRIRMELEAFAIHMVAQIPEESGSNG
jgi:hypothetical protein